MAADLPIHFFTIVVNGEPFIRHHIEVFRRLSRPWHWHIVEGVAALNHDSSWSVARGGRVPEALHADGLSIDGTSAYLDGLARDFPDEVTLYRPAGQALWDGKRAMVAAPLSNIHEQCLLFQVDVDELWTTAQLERARELFVTQSTRTAAWYWCRYFVGPRLVVVDGPDRGWTRNPTTEWLRTWRYSPGMRWASHSPPVLLGTRADGRDYDVGLEDPFFHDETEAAGLRFEHFAYATSAAVQWKEAYYGYAGALGKWRALQSETQLPVKLRRFFDWVADDTEVDRPRPGVEPLAVADGEHWRFAGDAPLRVPTVRRPVAPVVVIDGFFFQGLSGGIGRAWAAILREWAQDKDGFGAHVVLIDRAYTAPRLPGIRCRVLGPLDYAEVEVDRARVQRVCDEEGAAVFASTYYTSPLTTPSVMLVHDMIPEVLKWDLTAPMWREKAHALQHAKALVAVSHRTAFDVARFCGDLVREADITVAHLGAAQIFSPTATANDARVTARIARPFFVLFSARGGTYKNTSLFFQALARLPHPERYAVVCVGREPIDAAQQEICATLGVTLHSGPLSDAALAAVYRHARALVYPSAYEGFGLPVLEAMAAGCPVIACPVASIPEVLGDAGLYVATTDIDAMAALLDEVQRPTVRARCRERGLERARQFSWARTAAILKEVLLRVAG